VSADRGRSREAGILLDRGDPRIGLPDLAGGRPAVRGLGRAARRRGGRYNRPGGGSPRDGAGGLPLHALARNSRPARTGLPGGAAPSLRVPGPRAVQFYASFRRGRVDATLAGRPRTARPLMNDDANPLRVGVPPKTETFPDGTVRVILDDGLVDT